ncbi:TonB-linked outer membrane protein, SusC/RagA family [Pedobacter africanus]|uniref:TonB-linked outer membrane protein, SusC/RagA family n=2 Tax=Pedobacter africanus TaxID=151894 RepID=A0A1W2AGQ3_9SPHI|nr:TonB-linked outer membrane protein, SusC/RagA family [Pedobacter africanus]
MKKTKLFFQNHFARCYRKHFLKMKLLLILALLTIHTRASLYSQTRITMELKNTPLSSVLRKIEQKTTYRFAYNNEVVPFKKLVNIDVKDAGISEIMTKLLDKLPLTYNVVNNVVVISAIDRPAATTNPAEAVLVQGTVSDEQNLPFPGVNIRSQKHPSITSVTDPKGQFRITLPDAADVLIFSFVGYQIAEQPLPVSGALNISLKPLGGLLNEVVINGYGKQARAITTGAVGLVKSQELENRAYTSIDQSLQGRVAGLQSVGSSGQPGALQQIRIRGIGSISAGSDPLFVIDGVIVSAGQLSRATTTSNALSAINPNDIESINVLKDASASAIYGSRAANGVIIITTKQGAQGKTKVNFDAEYGITKLGKIPEAGKLLTTGQWRTLTAQGVLNNPSYAKLNGVTADNVFTFLDNKFGSGNGLNTNWLDLVQRDGRQQQYNLGISGGTGNTQYHVSGGYFKQQGTVIASDFNRYSFKVNLKTKVTDRLSLSTTLILGANGQNSPANGSSSDNPITAAVHLFPFISPYNADGTYNTDAAVFGSKSNPLYTAKYNKNKLSQLKGLGTLSAAYKITDNLSFTSRIGTDYNNLEEDTYYNPTHGAGAFYDNGYSSRAYTRYFNWTWTNMIDYHLDLKRDQTWVTNIKLGYEAQKSQNYTATASTTGLPGNPAATVPSNGTNPFEASGANSDYTIASLLSLADFSYKGKYVISGSYRRDGSSRFSEKNRYGNFWSAGASWNIQEEAFLKPLKFINILKLRTSYGLTGNANIDDYGWRQLYSYGVSSDYSVSYYNFNYDGEVGSGPTSVGNPYLTWETNKQLNLGIDAGLFNNRLSFTFDYYNRKATDLLLSQPTSGTTGAGAFLNNIGSMRNRGVEFSINGTPVQTADFKWSAGFNISRNINKITSLVDGKDMKGSSVIRRVGLDFQTYYLRQWAGVDPANGKPLWYTDETRTATTSNYNLAKLVPNHSATPKVFGSFTSAFAYKGFSLDGLFYYNFGNHVMDLWSRYTQSDGDNSSFNHFASQLGAWQKPGDITDVPIYIFNNTNNSSRASSRFLYKGDYIRLRELTLAYAFQKAVLSKAKIEGLSIYVRGTNLATWVRDKKLPYDPEAGLTGQSNYNIPMPKVFTLGLNLKF